MLISTSQMSRVHSLQNIELGPNINGKLLERVSNSKLLGVHLNENLKWDEHVNELSISCDGVLRTLRKLKNFTNFKLRKQLAETLILTELDDCDIIFNPLPEYLVKRLQRVQHAAAGFVISKYVRETKDLVKIGWLPVKERKKGMAFTQGHP